MERETVENIEMGLKEVDFNLRCGRYNPKKNT